MDQKLVHGLSAMQGVEADVLLREVNLASYQSMTPAVAQFNAPAFDSVERATAAHDSEGYQAALRALCNSAERDIRIVGIG